jgi:hypothetical protein
LKLKTTNPYPTAYCRNQPKSLSGIETNEKQMGLVRYVGRNQPKSLSGIETGGYLIPAVITESRNQPKSLSGIETFDNISAALLLIQPEST